MDMEDSWVIDLKSSKLKSEYGTHQQVQFEESWFVDVNGDRIPLPRCDKCGKPMFLLIGIAATAWKCKRDCHRSKNEKI